MSIPRLALAVLLLSCGPVGDSVLVTPRPTPPVTVCLDGLDDYRASFLEAVASVNRAAGCEILVVTDACPCTVRVYSDGLLFGNALAVRERGEIIIAHPGDITEAYLRIAHELGHILGLEHDPPVSDGAGFVSMMTPDVSAHADRLDRGLMLPWWEANDARALREEYCR